MDYWSKYFSISQEVYIFVYCIFLIWPIISLCTLFNRLSFMILFLIYYINCYFACIISSTSIFLSVPFCFIHDITYWDLFICLRYLNFRQSCLISLLEIIQNYIASFWPLSIYAPFHLRGFILGTNLSTTLQAWLAVWYCSCRTFILIGAFTAGICDLITIFIWVVSGNCFSKFWNELSFGLLFHIVFSPRINDNSFQLIFFSSCLFSSPYVGSTNSLLEFMYSLTYIFRGWLWILKCQ